MKRLTAVFLIMLFLFSFPLPAAAMDRAAAPSSVLSLADIYQAAKNIFVPKEDYFHNKLKHLNDLVNDRFAGLGHLYLMLNDFFKRLNNPKEASLTFTLPDSYFFAGSGGFTGDLLYSAKPYINMLRGVLNGAVCIYTAIVCYHKLRKFFSE